MNLFALASLSVTICCFGLSIFVFMIGKAKLHKIWALFNSLITMWALGIFFAGISTNPFSAALFWKLTYIPCTFIAVVYYHLIIEFCSIKKTKMLVSSYFLGTIFIPIILFSNYFIKNIFLAFDSIYYNQSTVLFLLWISLWLAIVILSFIELYKFIQTSIGIKKTQSLFLFWSMILGHSGGAMTTLPSFGILLYPVTHFMICIYMIICTYAIFKFQLMQLTIVIKKSFIYTIALAIISISYLLIVFGTENILQIFLGYNSFYVSVLTAFILGILFIPLRHQIQSIIDHYFFHGTANEISEQNEQLRQEITQSEKHKAIANLASGIAHEIKNPLTSLKTFHQYYLEKKNDPEFITKFNHIAGKELNRIEHLVQQLLDFSKPSPAEFKRTDIHQLIEGTLDLVSNQLKSNKITVYKNFTLSIEHLPIDPSKIKQALLNIILNAIEAMPSGGTLTVETRVIGLKDLRAKDNGPLPLKSSNPQFQIIISDTGSGIDKSDLKRIFDPFFSKKASGTGLGLAITQGIIEEHKGKIEVKNNPTSGCAFTIKLRTS